MGHLALFYKDFSYSRGLVVLGQLDAGLNQLVATSAGLVRIESTP